MTYGSFNHLTKITPTLLDLWTRIMNRVPEARLVLKASALSSPGVRERFMNAIEERGWAERVELLPHLSDIADHHRAYHRTGHGKGPGDGV